MATAPAPQSKAPIIALILAGSLLASFNQSLMNVALDQVARAFSVDLAVANWTILGFTIVTATVITASTTLLHRYGLRRTMLGAWAISLSGAALGLMSWDFASLLIARLIQAVSVGISYPVATSALMAIAPQKHAPTVLALNSAAIGLGLAIIPVVSGLLMTHAILQAVFLVPMVFSAALLGAGWFLLRDILPRQHHGIDAASMGLSFVGLGLLMYGLSLISHSSNASLALMAAGTAALILFAYRQFKIPEPLLDLRPFKRPSFTAGEIAAMLATTGSIYQSLLIPLYLEGVLDRTPFEAGLFLLVPVLCYAAGCFASGRIGGAHGIWPPTPAALAALVIGLAGIALASQSRLVIPMLISSCIAYTGVGLAFPALKSHALGALPKDLTSSGSSIHSALVQITNSVGSALFVGLAASDVARLAADGVVRAAAHAQGFSHTLLIEIAIVAAALLGTVLLHGAARKRANKKAEAARVDSPGRTQI